MTDEKVQINENGRDIRVTSEPLDLKKVVSDRDSATQSKPADSGAKPGRKPLFRS